MKKKTILVAAIAVMLVAALVVGGTLAYFTDKTETVKNTFTVGNVGIDLTETEWDAKADHTLVPGKFYDKNPTITVDAKSQDAYVFLKLDLNKYVSLINLMGVDAYKNHIGGLTGDYPGFVQFVNNLASDNALRAAVLDRWFGGVNHADWKVMNLDQIKAAKDPEHLVVVLGYQKNGGVVKANGTVKFMDKFGMPDTVTASMFDGTFDGTFNMTFTAYAIQADQIDNLDAAYTALGGYNAFAN